MTIYYIATTGNDTTGTGSQALPWATFTKAISVAVAGDTINASDGTYTENTSASGAWTIAKSVASDITIQSLNGIAANVIIVGASGASNTIFNTGASAHLYFKNLTFGMRSGSSYALRFNANCTNLTFDGCLIDASANASAIGGIAHVGAAGIVASSVVFLNCTTTTSPSGSYNGGTYFAPTGTGTISPVFTTCTLAGGVLLQNAGAGGTFNGCTISGAVKGIRTISAGTISITGGIIAGGSSNAIDANGAAITIANCLISNAVAVGTVTLGVDGTAGNATTGSMTNCTIVRNVALVGHALLVGAGCSNFVIDSCLVPAAYDYACVIKECAGAIVRYNTFVGGATVAANAALYFKAATGANAHHNKLIAGANFAARVLRGDTANKCGTITLVDNQIIVRRGVLFDWGGSGDDSGGSICDRNTYDTRTKFGTVYGTANVATLAAVRAAWATYNVTTNDAKSRQALHALPAIG